MVDVVPSGGHAESVFYTVIRDPGIISDTFSMYAAFRFSLNYVVCKCPDCDDSHRYIPHILIGMKKVARFKKKRY